MAHTIKRIVSVLMCVLLCLGLLNLGAMPASAASGTVGTGLSWSLENGTLTITGAGAIPDYTVNRPAPWKEYENLIQRVIITEGVTTVGRLAFYCCPNLMLVDLPDSVKQLREQAFAGCNKLTQINLTAVEYIGIGCFYECKSLVHITLGDMLHTIENKAFYHCTGLTGITIPASVTTFGNSVFTYCSSLVYVNVLANIEIIPYWSFFGCDVLREIYIPDKVQTVESNAFGDCPSLHHVDYGGNEDVKKEIQDQLDKSDMDPNQPKPNISYEQTEGSIITTTTKDDPETGEQKTTVDVTIKENSGWKDIADAVDNELRQGNDPQIDVYVKPNTPIPEGALNDLADREVVVNIHTSENVDWQVIVRDQNTDTLKGAQDFSVSMTKNDQSKYTDVIGAAESYTVTLGNTTLNSTVLFPLGVDTARKVATLYVVDGDELRKLSSVIVDDDGKAAFHVAGTEAGEYVVALNVPNISQEEVRIPQKLAAEYDITYGATLMDAYGNQYVLTGRVNKLGFGIGTLTLIVVGVLVGTGVVVGVVMTIWNKQNKKFANHRRSRNNCD